ncbi:MAG TPA: permease [Anaerolineae bacterium]|nr:permease [Anaerolineae bacterium]
MAPATSSDSRANSEFHERAGQSATAPSSCGSCTASSCSVEPDSFWRRLLRETWDATWMVVKFMLLAFFLSALIKLYVPSAWVAGVLGHQNPWAIPAAAFLGVPAYTSNLTAMPMLSGLLAQGMSPSAALAFLISGPTTTLPAMAAVWGLASRRVFALYVSFSLVGAVVLGYVHSLVTGLF